MCLAIPGRISEFTDAAGHLASVEISGVRRSVNVDLLREDGLEIGDWVLIHVGFAMSKISQEEAAQTLRTLELMGEAASARDEVEGYRFADNDASDTARNEPSSRKLESR